MFSLHAESQLQEVNEGRVSHMLQRIWIAVSVMGSTCISVDCVVNADQIVDQQIQDAGFPGKGGQGQEAFRQAAISALGRP